MRGLGPKVPLTGGEGGGGAKLLKWPYPLKVQARPPRDQGRKEGNVLFNDAINTF